ncbi:Rv3654c family TadE-like protein [Corynebacterium sp. H113]|uniref:Rv3654c family TadE-like protein n=1 Tax=Corynebacterium sp. H113 TaxID=3133419 RepID=UPI0030B6271C
MVGDSRRHVVRALRHSVGNDAGSTTVTGAFFISGLLVLVLVCVHAGIGLVEHRRDLVAADLSAVAAATALMAGRDACGVGEEIAKRNGASLDECDVDGVDVQVRIAKARARAGPAATAPEQR